MPPVQRCVGYWIAYRLPRWQQRLLMICCCRGSSAEQPALPHAERQRPQPSWMWVSSNSLQGIWVRAAEVSPCLATYQKLEAAALTGPHGCPHWGPRRL